MPIITPMTVMLITMMMPKIHLSQQSAQFRGKRKGLFHTKYPMSAHYPTRVESPVVAGFPPVLFSPLLVETLAVKIHCIRRIGNLILRSGIICSELRQGSQTIMKMVTSRVNFQSEQRFRHDLDYGHRL